MSFTFLLLLLFSHHLYAFQDNPREEITYLHTDIYVNVDCSITAQEKIQVYSLGKYIKYGISRRFPKSYIVTNVQKDNSPIPYSIYRPSKQDFQNLYIGDRTITLDPGIHTYTITYTVKRAVYPLFDIATNEHIQDFINWDIKGNNYGFFIKDISTTIHLPDSQSPNSPATFTLFSTLKSAMVDCSLPNTLIFYATRPIEKKECVKITAIWQKGFVNLTQCDSYIYVGKLLLSQLSIPAAIIIIILTLSRLYARRKRLYIREYTFLENPPHNILPEEAAYIFDGHLSICSVVATLIDMAQRNYLKIEKIAHNYVITQKQTTDNIIIYHKIAEILFKKENSSPLYKKEKELIKITKLMKQYCKDKQHFEEESFFIIIPLIISSIIFILTLLLVSSTSSPQIWPHTLYKYYKLFFITAFISGLCSWFLNKIPTNESITIIKHLEQFKLFLIVQPNFYTTFLEKQQKALLFEQNFPYAISLDAAGRWSEYAPKNCARNSFTGMGHLLYYLLPRLVPFREKHKYYQRTRRDVLRRGFDD